MNTPNTPSPLVWMHLGLGSFHRAHQAVYLQALHDTGDQTWVLASGNIRNDAPELMTQLAERGGAFVLETVTPQGQREYKEIRAIRQVIPHDSDLSAFKKLAVDPSTRIISFTVTEAGYYLDDKDQLDRRFEELVHDIEKVRSGQAGQTLYGALFALLKARAIQSPNSAITLLNCDNLRHNGDRSRKGLLQFIQAVGDQALLDWVQKWTTSPNAMVDRITPRPTPDVSQRVLEHTGMADPTAVMGESFIQWVIEENFANGRPNWERVGVQMVEDVSPYEEAKIRLLNATHSCIAWAGTLIGYQYIHEGTRHDAIRRLAYEYVTSDTIPVLDTPEHPCPVDLPKYRDVVIDRFSNPNIVDTNQRVAMDGFSKIPGFIAPTIRQRLQRNESIDAVIMLPALFLAFLQRWHVNKIPYQYQDQAMSPDTAHAICEASDPVLSFASNAMLWGELAQDPRLVAALRAAMIRVDSFIKEHSHV